MLAKVKQTSHKTLIAFVLTVSLVFSVFQFSSNTNLPTMGAGFANSLTPETFAVAYVSVDPEPFPHHPPN